MEFEVCPVCKPLTCERSCAVRDGINGSSRACNDKCTLEIEFRGGVETIVWTCKKAACHARKEAIKAHKEHIVFSRTATA